MKDFRIWIIVLFLVGIPLPSWAIEGFSGSIWGTAIYETTDSNPKTLGSIRQGVDWFKRYDLTFSTYGQLRYRFERNEAQFFNAYGPSVGMAVRHGSLRLGWEHQWDRLTGPDKTNKTSQIFFDWWYGWDLKNLKR
ncbi:MAG: hypothetical protein AABY46_01245 [Nitrospirota bacterium]